MPTLADWKAWSSWSQIEPASIGRGDLPAASVTRPFDSGAARDVDLFAGGRGLTVLDDLLNQGEGDLNAGVVAYDNATLERYRSIFTQEYRAYYRHTFTNLDELCSGSVAFLHH